MGVHGLWQLINSTGKPVPLDALEGKVLAVDVSVWLHQLAKGMRDSAGNPVANAHLHGLFTRICKLLHCRIKPVFVFDGPAPELKRKTLAARRNKREDAEENSAVMQQKILTNLIRTQACKEALGEATLASLPALPKGGNSKPGKRDAIFELPPLPETSNVVQAEIQKILTNLILTQACKEALGEATLASLPALPKGGNSKPGKRDAIFELPPLPETSKVYMSQVSGEGDMCMVEKRELQEFIEEEYADLNAVDVESEDFKSLPAELQHELIEDMKKRRKNYNLSKIIELPEDSKDFSNFQMAKLLKYNKLNTRLEDVRKELNQRQTKDLGKYYKSKDYYRTSIDSHRVASDDMAHYILIKGIKKRKEMEREEKKKMKKEARTVVDDSEDSNNAVDELLQNSDNEELEDLDFIKSSSQGSMERVSVDTERTENDKKEKSVKSENKASGIKGKGGIRFVEGVVASPEKERFRPVIEIDTSDSSDSEDEQDGKVDDGSDSDEVTIVKEEFVTDPNMMGGFSDYSGDHDLQYAIELSLKDQNSGLSRTPLGNTSEKTQKDTLKQANKDNKSSHRSEISQGKLSDDKSTKVSQNSSKHKHSRASDNGKKQARTAADKAIEAKPAKTLDIKDNTTSSKLTLVNVEKEMKGTGSIWKRQKSNKSNEDDENTSLDKKASGDVKNTTKKEGNTNSKLTLVNVEKEMKGTGSIWKRQKSNRSNEDNEATTLNKGPQVDTGTTDKSKSSQNVLKRKRATGADEDNTPVVVGKKGKGVQGQILKRRKSDMSNGSEEDQAPIVLAKSGKGLTGNKRKSAGDDEGIKALVSKRSKRAALSDSEQDDEEEEEDLPRRIRITEDSGEMAAEDEELASNEEDASNSEDDEFLEVKISVDAVQEDDLFPASMFEVQEEEEEAPEEDEVPIDVVDEKENEVGDSLKEPEDVAVPLNRADHVILEEDDQDDLDKTGEDGVSEAEEEVEMPELEGSQENQTTDHVMQQVKHTDPSTDLVKAYKSMEESNIRGLKAGYEKETRALQQEQGRAARAAASITDQMHAEAQELLQLFGIPFIVSPSEAEAQCAQLDLARLTQGTITDDSDVWLFGGSVVYKNFFNQAKYVECFKSVHIQSQLGLSREKLINLALLCGSDYTEGLQGVGPVTAMEILVQFQGEGIEGLVKLKDWWEASQKQIRLPTESKLMTKIRSLDLKPGFPSPLVVDAYLQPMVEDSTEKFSWALPDLEQLRQFATSKLGWSRQKTDELLLPVLKRLNFKQTQRAINSFFQPEVYAQPAKMKSKRLQKVVNKFLHPEEATLTDTPPTAGVDTESKPARQKGKARGKAKQKAETQDEVEVNDEDQEKPSKAKGKPRGRGRAKDTVKLDEIDDQEKPGKAKVKPTGRSRARVVADKGSTSKGETKSKEEGEDNLKDKVELDVGDDVEGGLSKSQEVKDKLGQVRGRGRGSRGRGRGKAVGNKRGKNIVEIDDSASSGTSDSESDSDSSDSNISYSDDSDDHNVAAAKVTKSSLSVAEILGLKIGNETLEKEAIEVEAVAGNSEDIYASFKHSHVSNASPGVANMKVFETGINVEELMKLQSGDEEMDDVSEISDLNHELLDNDDDEKLDDEKVETEDVAEMSDSEDSEFYKNEGGFVRDEDDDNEEHCESSKLKTVNKENEVETNQEKDKDSRKVHNENKATKSELDEDLTINSKLVDQDNSSLEARKNPTEIETVEKHKDRKRKVVEETDSEKDVVSTRKRSRRNVDVKERENKDITETSKEVKTETDAGIVKIEADETEEIAMDVTEDSNTEKAVKPVVKKETNSRKKKTKADTGQFIIDSGDSVIRKIVTGVPWAEAGKKRKGPGKGQSKGAGGTGRSLQPVEIVQRKPRVKQAASKPRIGVVNLSESDSDSSSS